MRKFKTEIAVIGGGPAGLAAAAGAAPRARVTLLDDNPQFGGQIWRASLTKIDDRAARFIAELDANGAVLMNAATVHSAEGERALVGEDLNGPFSITYEKLILATGARELFLPFPGWTLPGVFGAGGLQALVKGGLDVRGKRIVVAGTGPLLLAVAAHLKSYGATIVAVLEQTRNIALTLFAFNLLRMPSKLSGAAALRLRLGFTPYKADSWVTRCEKVESGLKVEYLSNGSPDVAKCDYLACGFHLVPSLELAQMLGCRIDNATVWVDELQRTSIPGIYCSGEATGIGGVELSMAEGRIAGFAASGREQAAEWISRKRGALRNFADKLNRAFALRAEVLHLAEESTIVCRCEDVTYGRLREFSSWRSAKLQTRCGMGPCQGRICGAATREIFGWGPEDVRQPIFPVKLENL